MRNEISDEAAAIMGLDWGRGRRSTRWSWVGRAHCTLVENTSAYRVNLENWRSTKGTARTKREDVGSVPVGSRKGGSFREDGLQICSTLAAAFVGIPMRALATARYSQRAARVAARRRS
jgi:hypothetical protein